MRGKLNIRQEKFCQEYVKSGNATAAMLEAYPSRSRWKPETRNNAAYKLLQNGDVLARVDELREEARRASDVSRDEILRLLSRVIRGEPVTDFEQNLIAGEKSTRSSKSLSVAWAVERLCKMCGFDSPEKIDMLLSERPDREALERELRRLEGL